MKYNKLILFIYLLAFSVAATAQKKEHEQTRNMIESGQYVFKAQTAYPMSGNIRYLTPEYDLTIAKGKVISYLPYFGRSYVPVLSGEAGLKFSSSDFAYAKTMKGDKWEISIKPRDVSDITQMDLTVFDNGRARLVVISTNRQEISFDGYIRSTG